MSSQMARYDTFLGQYEIPVYISISNLFFLSLDFGLGFKVENEQCLGIRLGSWLVYVFIPAVQRLLQRQKCRLGLCLGLVVRG